MSRGPTVEATRVRRGAQQGKESIWGRETGWCGGAEGQSRARELDGINYSVSDGLQGYIVPHRDCRQGFITVNGK